MTTITTVAELDALPEGAEITDRDGDTWRKVRVEMWQLNESPDQRQPIQYIHAYYAPLHVASMPPTPAVSPPHMTKCCGHGCTNTAALQPGSSYLCPDHGDGGCSAEIKTEGN